MQSNDNKSKWEALGEEKAPSQQEVPPTNVQLAPGGPGGPRGHGGPSSYAKPAPEGWRGLSYWLATQPGDKVQETLHGIRRGFMDYHGDHTRYVEQANDQEAQNDKHVKVCLWGVVAHHIRGLVTHITLTATQPLGAQVTCDGTTTSHSVADGHLPSC